MSAIGPAKAIGVPRTRNERLVKERTGVNPDTALRLSRALGATPEFRIDMRTGHDMAAARRNVDVSGIEPPVAA